MDPDREESIRRFHSQHRHECEGCEILDAWDEDRIALTVALAKAQAIVEAMRKLLST